MRDERRQYVIYISGAYSGTSEQISENIVMARQWAIKIWEAGFTVLCPHLNTAHFEIDCKMDYGCYIDGDLHLLDRCDAVFMIPENWKLSPGAHEEHDHAKRTDKPIFYKFENLLLYNWIDPWDVLLGGHNE